MTNKAKAIVAGHICLDVTPQFAGRQIGDINEFLKPGKLINVGSADVHTGGAVANTGLAMKIMGADATLIGKIGRDAFGDMVMSILNEHDAANHMLRSDTESTSYSVVLAVPGYDRMFLHNPGTNDTFRPKDIPEKELEEAGLFHFGYPPLMRSMYEKTGCGIIQLMKRVHEAGLVTSLDLAAVDPNSDAGREHWETILSNTLPWVDIFVPSIEEICFMLDLSRYEAWQARADGGDVTEVLDFEADIVPLAEKCLNMGVKILLLKCGARGMYCCASDKGRLTRMEQIIGIDAAKWDHFSTFERSYVPDRVLSGTGAGDTSIAAFLTAMLSGEDPEMCMHLAAAAGASCVAAYDALGGLCTLEELKEKIDAGWEKYPEN